MSQNIGRQKKLINFTLTPKEINILDEIVNLKRQLDKASGHHVARGSREAFVRYSRTQALADCIEAGAAGVVHNLQEQIRLAQAIEPKTDDTTAYGEEALRRKVLDFSSKGWEMM